ncbi:MAG: MFS transporter [Phycisphaerae bacterium]|nr:MFS transporter [Phycisphaerae bacterium]
MANTTRNAAVDDGPKDAAGFFDRFLLRGAPRELWMIFAIHLVGYVSYMIMNWTFVLWLSYDLGYSDEKAGLWVALWSALMTLVTVFVGSLTDAIGIRKALLLSMVICIVTRCFMTFASAKWMVLGLGMIPVAIGEALGTPAMVAATRRYSRTSQRSVSFSYFYASMNVGILIAGFMFDFIRRRVGEPVGHWSLPLFDITLTTYQTVFLVSLVFQCGLFPILYWGMREGVEATDEGVKIVPGQSRYPHESFLRALAFSLRDTYRETVRIFTGLFAQPGFYKFLGFLALAAMVRLIFVHMNYTYPKFGIRELGPGAPVGTLYNINAFMIIFLVPIVGVLSRKVSAYKMVTVGSGIAAASVFIMTLPPAWFQGVADLEYVRWLAHHGLGLVGDVNPWYVMIFYFIVILSFGEAIYSPRLYEYAAAIAPKGQEGSYMSLSYLPFFLAKLSVATFSGVLLSRYCPEAGPRSSGTLWLIIALTTTICPAGLIAFRRWIRVKEAGRAE